MKKIVVILVIIIFSVLGIWAGIKNTNEEKQLLTPLIPKEILTPSNPTPNIIVSAPLKIEIPKINVITSVESVGLDNKERMDIPKNVYNVGWYNLGPKPGELGSSVIDGHLDTQSGSPAVFYYLSSLTQGDVIKIIDESNNTYTYQVTDKQTYDFDKVPMEKIFARRDKRRLNLITCDGVFDQGTRNYSKRLVVYSEMIE